MHGILKTEKKMNFFTGNFELAFMFMPNSQVAS